MTRIAVVTDSSAYLPEELVREYGIRVVPLNVHFNGAVYKDLVDITEDEFFRKLAAAPELPSTSQPSAGEFAEVFRAAAQGADGVFAVVISSALSGTYSSAMAAKEMLPDIPIAVVDSRSVSMGLGFQALAAARAAREGRSLEEIVSLVEALVPRTRVYFLLDTLKYLAKGGRIGGAEALLGSVLAIKPLLQIENGRVEPLDKVRTRNKAIGRLMEHFKKECDGHAVHCAVLNAQVPDEAEELRKEVARAFPAVKDLVIARVSPVIATHTGPGALGLCFYTE
jgi:DegV family protein with EDD domain